MKNSTNTNLLILDEIFDSSLDGTGTDEFLKILNTLSGENVFVISHKQDVLVDKFRSTIKFEKIRNFSHVALELLEILLIMMSVIHLVTKFFLY